MTGLPNIDGAPHAWVVQVRAIDVHPHADRLVILRLNIGEDVVSGPHYEEGQRGVYIPAPAELPGYLAEDLWMVAKGERWVDLAPRNMRGVLSPGIFCGERWRTKPGEPWQAWPLWRARWRLGQDVAAYLGVR